LVFPFPLFLIGCVTALLLANRGKFGSNKYFLSYFSIWMLVGSISFVSLSAMSLDGSEGKSPFLILIGWILYFGLIVGPAFFQNRNVRINSASGS